MMILPTCRPLAMKRNALAREAGIIAMRRHMGAAQRHLQQLQQFADKCWILDAHPIRGA